jgi:hypothetical protein
MSERPRADIIERIRKILKKTEENGCTEVEAQNAFKLASHIMAQYNLTMADVESTGQPDGEEIGWFEEEAYEAGGRWTLEDNYAYFLVKEFFFVEGYIRTRRTNGRTDKRLYLFGKPSNVEVAKWAFGALIDAFDRLFREYRYRTGAPAAERRIFVTGIARGFEDKMREERQALEIQRDMECRAEGKSNGPGTALVLAHIRQKTAAAFAEAHREVGKARSNFSALVGTQGALQAGYNAGRALKLARPIDGESRKALSG